MTEVGLSDTEEERIFEEIRSDLLADEEGRELPAIPELVLLGGQPGSGKTGVLNASFAALRARGATWAINADDFAAYHPGYESLQLKYGAEAADLVRGVTASWIKRVIAAAQERRVNVVFESTMRQPAVVLSTLAEFRASGYATHAKVLAVRPMESWQGNHYRRERLAAAGALSRIATRESHDAALAGSLTTVRLIEQERASDRLTIVDRSNRVLLQAEMVAGSAFGPLRAAERLRELREAPMAVGEASRHLGRWGIIEALARARHALGAGSNGAPAKTAGDEISAIAASRASDTFRLVVDRSYPESAAMADVPALASAFSAYRDVDRFLAQASRGDKELYQACILQAADLLQKRIASGQVGGFLNRDWLQVAEDSYLKGRDAQR